MARGLIVVTPFKFKPVRERILARDRRPAFVPLQEKSEPGREQYDAEHKEKRARRGEDRDRRADVVIHVDDETFFVVAKEDGAAVVGGQHAADLDFDNVVLHDD